MGKEAKVRYVAIGKCPKCHTEYIRPFPCDAAACLCQNPDAVLIELEPTLILPNQLYRKLQEIAELAGVQFEDFVNQLLVTAAKEKLEYIQK